MRLLRSLVFLTLHAPVAAFSQEQSPSDEARHRADCRLARQILETGQPAAHAEWARGYIAYCGFEEWGKAAAAAVQRLRTTTDLQELELYWADSQWLADRALFEAALEIAGDRSAAVPARVFAFRALRQLRYPYQVLGYAAMLNAFKERGWSGSRCYDRRTYHRRPMYHGVPLPSDYEDRIREVARHVTDDESEPIDVRSAAACSLKHGD
jgi:hypothetical protein